jgi:proliferating cell nuclear antigen
MEDAKLWKNLISAISTLIDEVSFNATPEGIELRAMDPSHVAMVDFYWPKMAFDEYSCDQATKISFNVKEMLKLIRRVKGDESIELTLDSKEGKVSMRIHGKYTRTFNMAILDITAEEVPTPKITFNTKVKLTTENLSEAMDDAALVSDNIRLESSQGKLTLRATGDMGSAIIELDKESAALLDIEVKEEAKATYSLNYLANIVREASNISEIVTLEYSNNMPVKLDFELLQQGKLSYYVAPRIETE